MDKLLNLDHILVGVSVDNQKDAFQLIAEQFVKSGLADDVKKCYKGLIKREKEGSTGFNDGIAIPHAKIKEITKPGVFVFKFANGVEWKSIDGSKVRIAIALAIPDGDKSHDHLKVLSSIARKLIDDNFRNSLLSAATAQQLFDIVSNVEII